jgi:hypothetical protein
MDPGGCYDYRGHMFDQLAERGFQFAFASHAAAILAGDFPDAIEELKAVGLPASVVTFGERLDVGQIAGGDDSVVQ